MSAFHFLVVCGCSVIVLAGRDAADNTTVIEVRHSSSFVQLEGRSEGGSSQSSAVAQGAVGEFHKESAAALQWPTPGAVVKAKAAPKAITESSAQEQRQKPRRNVGNPAAAAAASAGLESSVNQAIKASIKSIGPAHQPKANAAFIKSSGPPYEEKMHKVSKAAVKPRHNHLASKKVADHSSFTVAAQKVPHHIVTEHGHAHPRSPAPMSAARADPRGSLAHGPLGVQAELEDKGPTKPSVEPWDADAMISLAKREDQEETEELQEAAQMTSTEAPNETVEELERNSTSVLSVIYFTYLLLALAASAALAAYVTSPRTEASEDEQSQKDKWKHILRHGNFTSGRYSRPQQCGDAPK